MPSEKWGWDVSSRRYRNLETGRFISHARVAGIRNDFAAAHRRWADDIASNVAQRELSVPRWEQEVRVRIKRVWLAEYMLGRGGKHAMTQADYGAVGRMLRDQYGYLRQFALDMAAGTMTERQIAARMQLYFEGAVQAFERGKAAAYSTELILPCYPADGRTECRSRCRCRWSIRETKKEWRATWMLGRAEHCTGCLDRSRLYAPYVQRKVTEGTP